MLAGPQLVAGPAAPGGERARLLSLYVQDYLECVESLPLDIQRNASLLREMDTQCQGGCHRGTRPPPQDTGRGRKRGGRPLAAHAPGAEGPELGRVRWREVGAGVGPLPGPARG